MKPLGRTDKWHTKHSPTASQINNAKQKTKHTDGLSTPVLLFGQLQNMPKKLKLQDKQNLR